MEIPLNDLENTINPTILQRGLSYYENGHVERCTLINENEYELTVSGSEDYTVNLEILGDKVVDYQCNCPYDMGPVCKHVVAAILYLKEYELDDSSSVKITKKEQSVNQKLQDIFDKVSHQDLAEFIEEQCRKDQKLRSHFFTYFAYLSTNQSKEFYHKQIKTVIDAATDRDGFIGWDEVYDLEQGLAPIVAMAENNCEKGNYSAAIDINLALMEELVETLQYADDSSGSIGGLIDGACELLKDIAKKEISEEIRDYLFNYGLEAYEKKIFSGWDWHTEILALTCELAKNESEANMLIKRLESVSREYEKERAEQFQKQLLERFKSATEVEAFIESHLTNSSIRTEEIEKAVNNGNYERAIKLAKDGITYDKAEHPGLLAGWYNWLLKIAQTQNDMTKIIEYARYLFIDNSRSEQDYYAILKQTVAVSAWNNFVEELIQEIANRSHFWRSQSLIRQIYINEEWWDRLFALLKKNVTLINIENDEQYLAKDYSAELVNLYSEEVNIFLAQNTGRGPYQTACRYLRRMKKLGGGEKVKKLVIQFKAEYPRRRALLEELDKV